jgi:20S proteasome alpha/beta subunit
MEDRPRPLKHGYARAMTIALGILASDGIVIAADSEISAGEYMSVEGQKVTAMTHFTNEPDQPHGNIVMAGSGDAGYLEAIYPEVTRLFKDALDLDAFYEELQKYILEFYDDHVIPFSGERPHFSLIVGTKRGDDMRLWTTLRNRVIPCRGHFTAIGSGEMYATGILQRICGSQCADVSKLLAAYVIYQVKDRIPGCGKDTHVVSIKLNKLIPSGFGPRACAALERLFMDYGQIEAAIIHKVFGSTELGDWQGLPNDLETLKQAIAKAVS